MKRGFTLIELLLTMGIISMLFSISSILLSNIIPRANVESVAETIISELRSQQLKAMQGIKNSAGNISDYGVYLENSRYTLFEGSSYNSGSSSNQVYEIESTAGISTNFPNQTIVFTKGSGEIAGFVAGQNNITVTDTQTSSNRIINYNSYGVTE